jgi:hypothetical protein
MHLCDIPVERIHAVEIPTGLPLVYDSTLRRIRLLQESVGDTFSETGDCSNSSSSSSSSSIQSGSIEHASVTNLDSLQGRRGRLLTGEELLAKYNFGACPELLFHLAPPASEANAATTNILKVGDSKEAQSFDNVVFKMRF